MIMRAAFLVAAVALMGGCGDDTTSLAGGDLAAAADLAVPADLAQLSCANILACVAGCGQNLVCQAGCRDAGTTTSKGVYDVLAGCTAETCAPGDAGSGACQNATDTHTACLTCLANAAAHAVDPTSGCHTQYVTCAGS
jgi:hypothetical protein